MERYYEIAGIRIRIQGADDEMFADDGVLSLYRSENGPWQHSLRFKKVNLLEEPMGDEIFADAGIRVYQDDDLRISYIGPVSLGIGGAYMRIFRRGNTSEVQVKREKTWHRISPKTVLKAIEMEHLTAQNGSVLFHSAFIRYEDKAILFTAPSGTGKSTQADLWCEFAGAELINGDRSVMKVSEDCIYACGVPFSGSSAVRQNVTLPLAAVVYLSQSPQTQVLRLTGARAFRRIWEGCTMHIWDRDDVEHCSGTVMNAVSRVPVYHMPCTPDKSAVEILRAQLEKDGVL